MKNEIKNNIVHVFIGASLCACVFVVSNICNNCLSVGIVSHSIAFFAGIAIEVFQFFAWDERDPRIVDRILDVMGYQAGCALMLLYMMFIVGNGYGGVL